MSFLLCRLNFDFLQNRQNYMLSKPENIITAIKLRTYLIMSTGKEKMAFPDTF